MGELFAKGLNSLDYYMAVTFMPRDMANEFCRRVEWHEFERNELSKKDEFFLQALRQKDIDAGQPHFEARFPHYSFINLGVGYSHGYPLSLTGLSIMWGKVIVPRGFHGYDMIEMRIPKSAGLVGACDNKGFSIVDDDKVFKQCCELVTSGLHREWLVGVYSAKDLGDGVMQYTPGILTREMLTSKDVKFSETGRAEKDYWEFGTSSDLEYSGLDLANWLVRATPLALCTKLNDIAISFGFDRPSLFNPVRPLLDYGKLRRNLLKALINDLTVADAKEIFKDCVKKYH